MRSQRRFQYLQTVRANCLEGKKKMKHEKWRKGFIQVLILFSHPDIYVSMLGAFNIFCLYATTMRVLF